MFCTLASIFGQIVSIRVKTLNNTTLEALRHIKKEKATVPIDVLCLKPPLHSFLIINPPDRNVISIFSLTALNTEKSHATFIVELNNENCVAVAFQLRGLLQINKNLDIMFFHSIQEKNV